MSNYKSTQVSGESWVRSSKVLIDNPFQVTPMITFYEEKIISMGESEFAQKPLGSLHEVMTNPLQEYPLINPETGEDTGQTNSYYNLYIALHSLYLHLANRRDLEEAAAAEAREQLAIALATEAERVRLLGTP